MLFAPPQRSYHGSPSIRAAVRFVARPLLCAALLTVLVRVLLAPSALPARESGPETKGSGKLPVVIVPPATAKKQKAKTVAAAAWPPENVAGHDSSASRAQSDGGRRAASTAGRAADRALTKALVVASTSGQASEETAWLADVGSDWTVFHYVTDAPLSPALAVPVNKGNEAMAYLTYIVDHYETLPDVVFFHHGHRHAWHQAMDSLDEVQRLRAAYVARRGYAAARCLPGCENVIPLADYAVAQPDMPRFARDVQLTTLLDDFLDRAAGERVPKRLASPCCAQFAASRTAIQRRPVDWWRKLRQWLIDTPVPSAQSGRLLEHTWHVWLGNESYHCPEYDACQCHVFGIGQCDNYYALEKEL